MLAAIDYMLTAVCNLACPFCYGPDPVMKNELSINEKLALIDGLSQWGTGKLIIAGGEPTLSAHLRPVVQRAHDHGIETALQTNAFALPQIRNIARQLAWLAVPIDGITAAVQLAMRTSPRQLDNSIAAINTVRAINPSVRIRIGTVLTPFNTSELPAIGHAVLSLRPDIWKLYQVQFRGRAKRYKTDLSLSGAQFTEAASQALAVAGDVRVHISAAESGDSRLIVNPDSELLMPLGESYRSFGRLIGADDGEFRIRSIEQASARLDRRTYEFNMAESFPGWV